MKDGSNIQHPGLTEWLASRTTGASSKAIVAHLAGIGHQDGSYPRDAADFGRCIGLLDAVPSLRPDLPKMAEVNDYWAALIGQWDEITASDERTALIRNILKPIHDADPNHIELSETVSMRIGNAVKASKAKQGKPPMKPDPTFDAAADNAYRVTADELRQFIERWERLEAEKKDIADQQKEVLAESKARGYDTKAIRQLIALRKRDPADVAEEEAVLDVYKSALGMA